MYIWTLVATALDNVFSGLFIYLYIIMVREPNELSMPLAFHISLYYNEKRNSEQNCVEG